MLNYYALLDGLRLTLRHFFKKPITMSYPEQKWDFPQRFRGQMILRKNEEGKALCVACGLCEKTCPCSCISVIPTTGKDGIRKMEHYSLDLLRCCFCGLCVEACPMNAIYLGPNYELARRDKNKLLFMEDELLEKNIIDNSGDASWRNK